MCLCVCVCVVYAASLPHTASMLDFTRRKAPRCVVLLSIDLLDVAHDVTILPQKNKLTLASEVYEIEEPINTLR